MSSRTVALAPTDARYHAHVIGPTGKGKSTLLENWVLDDADQGLAVVYIDIKGDSVYRLLRRLPRKHWGRVVLLDPAHPDRSVGLNVLESPDLARRDLIADQVVAIFRRIFHDYWKDRSDDVMRNAVLTLMRQPGATLCDVPALLTDDKARARWTRRLDDPVGLEPFWTEYKALSDSQKAERAGPVLSRLRQILLRPSVRHILGQSKSTIDLGHILDHRGILLVSLAKGVLGEETAKLLGSLLMVQLWQATLRRAAVSEPQRPDATVIVDEFHNFVHLPAVFAEVLSESRGYHVGWVLAHQFMAQLDGLLRAAVMENAHTKIAYQCNDEESARSLAHVFPGLGAAELMALDQHQVAVRLCIDGHTSPAFTGRTLDVPESLGEEHAAALTLDALTRTGRPRQEVEEEIRRRLKNGANDADSIPGYEH